MNGKHSLSVNGSPADRYYLPALHHALDVLEAVQSQAAPLQLGEIAASAGLSKPAVHRILLNLIQRGYVTKNAADRSYSSGSRLWELGISHGWISALQEQLCPYMHELLSELHETIHLAVLDGFTILYVGKAEGSEGVRRYAQVGDRAPAHCVATGKVLLAVDATAQLNQLDADRLTRFTPTTITDRASLERELREVRSQGYALNLGEWREGVNGVAVPLQFRQSKPVAALGAAGPASRFGAAAARKAAQTLRRITRASELDFRASAHLPRWAAQKTLPPGSCAAGR